jgi:hypothetical protein
LLFAIVGTLCCAAQASATALTAGDVVIYRVGSGSEPLTSSATSVFLDEYEPSGGLATSLAFPTTTVGANKALVGGGAASSEGLITLSGNGAFVLATGYNAAVGTANVSGTKAKTVSRTIGRVNASGQIDTTTSLTDFANENNPRSAEASTSRTSAPRPRRSSTKPTRTSARSRLRTASSTPRLIPPSRELSRSPPWARACRRSNRR